MSKRTDANHSEIVKGLRAVGMSVLSIAPIGKGAPDVIAGGQIPCPHCGKCFPQNAMLEIKDGDKSPSRQQLTPAEKAFHLGWRGQVSIVYSLDEALKVITSV